MKINFRLFFIVLFSLAIRLTYLGNNPVILNRDEAAIGYTAYLLQKTGMDEWGRNWPLTLESFGDYKLLGYPLLVSALFNFIPPNDFTVRLPSAVFGTALIGALYLLTQRFTKNRNTALWTAFLSALTPIFFFYSRIAFEANVALFFLVIYIYFILRPIDKKTFVFDIFGLIFILLAVISYNTPLLLLPFIVLLIPFVRGVKNWRSWLFVTSGSVIISIVFFSVFSSLTAQKQGVTIFADSATILEYADYRSSFSGLTQLLIGNQYVYYSKIIIQNFLESFSPQFLVTKGGQHPWHAAPGWGHILLPLYITSLAGIALSIRNIFSATKIKNLKKICTVRLLENKPGRSLVLIYLAIISLAPSVITIDSPHATRSLFCIVVLVLFSALFIERITLLSKYRQSIFLVIMASCIILFVKYLADYFLRYPQQQVIILQSGFDRAMNEIDKKYPREKIAVVDQSGYQYILLAWYLKVSPEEFFSSIIKQDPDRIGFRYGQQVGRYHFIARSLDRSQDEKYVVEWKEDTWQLEKF